MGGKQSKDKSSLPSSSSSSFFKFKSKSRQIHNSNKKNLKTTKSASQLPIPQYAIPYSNSLPKNKDTPNTSQQHENVIEYKLYRSYSDIRQASTHEEVDSPKKSIIYQPDTPTNVKVYRKSSGADRFQSLLRGHQKKSRDTCATVQPSRKTEALPETSHFNTITAGQLRHTIQDNSPFSRGRASSHCSLNRTSSFKRAVSRLSSSSIGYNVSGSDMPSLSTVKKKTRQFELSFVRRLSDLIDSIPIEKLVKQVVVGVVQLPNGSFGGAEKQDCFFINIERYLLKKDQLDEIMVPLISKELVEKLKETLHYSTNRNYNVNNQDDLKPIEKECSHKGGTDDTDDTNIKHPNDINNNKIKNDKELDNTNISNKETNEKVTSNNINDCTVKTTKSIINNNKLSVLLKQIVNSHLISVSREISRIYEYQIAVMSDGLGMDLLSRYAADCVSNFMEFPGTSLPIFHVDSAVHSVVWASQTKSKLGDSTVSILIGEKELKWKIDEIFRKPGLRLDSLLYVTKIEITSPEQHPWRFFSHDNTEFLLYGYRGAVIDRSPRPDAYRIHRNEMSFNAEVGWLEEDFHRCYSPYRKLVGRKVIKMYNKMEESKKNKHSFTFSTPKQDLSIQSNDFEICENDEENSQILSFFSFVPFLLGDDVGKEDMEVVCRCLENENIVCSHFNNLEKKETDDFNTNNNNSNMQYEDILKDVNDCGSAIDDENSFRLKDLEYTKDLISVPCLKVNNQVGRSNSLENSYTIETSIKKERGLMHNDQPNISPSSSSDINNTNILIKKENNDIMNNQISKNLQIKNKKNVFKYSLTPLKSPQLVDANCYIPAKRVDSLELEDLYTKSDSRTCSNEDLTTTTTSACFNCGTEELRTSNEELSGCQSSPNHLNQSFGIESLRISDRSCAESKKSANTTKSSLASDV